jgi:hypothetical protein
MATDSKRVCDGSRQETIRGVVNRRVASDGEADRTVQVVIVRRPNRARFGSQGPMAINAKRMQAQSIGLGASIPQEICGSVAARGSPTSALRAQLG